MLYIPLNRGGRVTLYLQTEQALSIIVVRRASYLVGERDSIFLTMLLQYVHKKEG